jgi:hypothetical protein
MKISDIIDSVLGIGTPDQAAKVQVIVIKPTAPATQADYSNSPDEKYADISAAYPSGDDVHKSKQPADIRTNAPSMYPNFQAKE